MSRGWGVGILKVTLFDLAEGQFGGKAPIIRHITVYYLFFIELTLVTASNVQPQNIMVGVSSGRVKLRHI